MRKYFVSNSFFSTAALSSELYPMTASDSCPARRFGGVERVI